MLLHRASKLPCLTQAKHCHTVDSQRGLHHSLSREQSPSGGEGRFTVDSATGDVLIVGRAPFTCSSAEPHVLAVSAQGVGVPESTTTPAQNVTVFCEDINPQFFGYPYTLEIREGVPVGQT